jgi:hypothetical protein
MIFRCIVSSSDLQSFIMTRKSVLVISASLANVPFTLPQNCFSFLTKLALVWMIFEACTTPFASHIPAFSRQPPGQDQNFSYISWKTTRGVVMMRETVNMLHVQYLWHRVVPRWSESSFPIPSFTCISQGLLLSKSTILSTISSSFNICRQQSGCRLLASSQKT